MISFKLGYYLYSTKVKGVAQGFIDEEGAERIDQPKSFKSIHDDKALVCVDELLLCDVALLIRDCREFEWRADRMKTSPRVWLLMDKARSHQLANYIEPTSDVPYHRIDRRLASCRRVGERRKGSRRH